MQCRLFAYPFRVFFILTAGFAGLVIPAWLAVLKGWLALPPGLPPLWWHSHEMLYGLVPAAVAGFLLTAMANWTGLPPPRGRLLMGLALTWLAGRLAMAAAGAVPLTLVAIVDLAFLPSMAVVVFRTLWRAGNRRNLPLVAVLAALTVGNALMHAAFLGMGATLARSGELLGLNIIAVLLAIIGGRITPLFTANWLARHGGNPRSVRQHPRLDQAALASLVASLLIDLVAAGGTLAGVIALLAGVLHAARVLDWRGWHARSDPLTWILHVGYGWIPVALLLKGIAPFTAAVSPSAWFHALGVGAVATLILGVMTRVSVAHTGHGLILRPGARFIYALITAAAALRLSASLGSSWAGAVEAAGLAWAAAFVLFLIAYAPVLNRPRADGQPG